MSSSDIKQVELVFSACDGVMIDKKYLGLFHCDNIRWIARRTAVNSLSKHLYCDSLFLELHKDINQVPDAWDCPFPSGSDTPIFDRIVKTPDITAIRLIYEDDSSDYVLVPWDNTEDNKYVNICQQFIISGPGHLYLCVSCGKKLEDLVDLDSINNEACAGWTVRDD